MKYVIGITIVIPNDITKHTDGMQNNRVFYSKLNNGKRFYFRISISFINNSTTIFLADDKGEYICETLQDELLKGHHNLRVMGDGRTILYDHNLRVMGDGRTFLYEGEHTDDERALWAMSSYRHLYRSRENFKQVGPDLIFEFKRKMNDCQSVDDCQTLFSQIFSEHADKYQQLLDASTPN
jgi:hypothetical protein